MKVKRRRNKNKEKTVILSARIPQSLNDRISELSVKNLITKTAWVVKALEQKAYKHTDHSKLLLSEDIASKNDSVRSGKGEG